MLLSVLFLLDQVGSMMPQIHVPTDVSSFSKSNDVRAHPFCSSRQGAHGVFVCAAAMLLVGLERSPCNFQMKLLLCRVYSYLGAGAAIFETVVDLSIKQIQMDSLSYMILDPLLALGEYKHARDICERICAVHESTNRDTPEFIARAYRLGT